jgi:YD repeat-containing protein
MKRIFSCLLLLLCISTVCMSQNYDDMSTVALPSPNNNFLEGASQVGVNLYTGTPQISIPLYSLASKDITIPVSLSYVKADGVKVQDVANFTGLGWQLIAGGSISRVVRSLPDEIPKGYIGTGQSGKALMNALAGNVNMQAGFDEQISKGQLDGEPDLFNVMTPFFSFQFVMDENGNPVISNNNGIKITHNLYNNANYQNTSWIITDTKGNQYYFGSGWTYRETVTTKLFETDYTFTSTWYLEKIVSFNSKDAVSFDYTYGSDYSYKHYLKSKTVYETIAGSCSPPASPEIKDLTQTYTYHSPKYISRISSALGEINFKYEFNRQDIANAGKLTSIEVKAFDQVWFFNKDVIKKYEFNYSYFGNSSSNEALRLKLDYINMYGTVTATTPLRFKTFEYYTDANLPARSSVEFDYSGYYNVNASGTALTPDGANKQPNETRTKANVLKSITDLSGVTDRFEYELNQIWDNAANSNKILSGLRIRKISQVLPAGETTFTEYVYSDNAGKSYGQVYKSSYDNFSRWIFRYSGISGNEVCGINGRNYLTESIIDEYDLNGPLVGYSTVKVVNQNGGYEINNYYNFSDFPDVVTLTNVSSSDPQRQLGAHTSQAYKRGLLTSRIIYKANGDKITEVINTYNPLNSVVKKAFGLRTYPWNHVILGGSGYIKWTESVYNSNVENYELTKSISRSYDQNNQALFRESTVDYTYADNKYLIKIASTADSKGVTKTSTNYYPGDAGIPNVSPDEQTAINALVQANRTSIPVHTTETVNGVSFHNHNIFKKSVDLYLKSIVLLAGSSSYINNNLAEGQVKKKQYEYDGNTLNIISSGSNSEPTRAVLYGYNNSLITAEVTNAENRSWVTVVNSTNNGSLYWSGDGSAQSTTMKVDYNGNVDLSIALGNTTNTNAEVNYTLSGPAYYSGSLCVSANNSCYYGSSISLANVPPGTYTLTVTPVEFPADVNFEFDYVYPQSYGSTEGVNECFYEGFERDGNTADPCAGEKCMRGYYTVPFVKPNDRAYQVDYHYYLNGKWYSASKPYENNMVLNDGSGIDEVRVYPKDGIMKTYTYDPLVGITSQCDENNRITYYEYDALGRLALIRDQDKNIVKKICYNYAGQAGDCSFFGNATVIQSFTRNNCGGDAIGSSVPYTVAANTFYSATSPDDANNKAKNYVQANGPANANKLGSCTPIHWNEERVKYFYSQTCAADARPEPYPATVHARTVYSLIDVADANRLADAQIDSWGQQEANYYGTCTPTRVAVSYGLHNNVYDLRVLFHNLTTGENFDFDMYSYGTLDPIPIGAYDVTVYDPSGSYNGYRVDLCGFSEWGFPVTFYNVQLDQYCHEINVY